MTNIADARSLHQYMLTFIKLRIAAQGTYPGDLRAGFRAWLLANGHTLTPGMNLQLAGYGWITTLNAAADFTTFSMTNLPVDGETVPAYVLRYQFERLSSGLLLDDAARARLLTDVIVLEAQGDVNAHWNVWFPTDPANGGRTFPQMIAAFKTALAAHGRVLTGGAVARLAGARGFNVATWVSTQTGAIAAAHGAADRWLPKTDEGAACWNWALTAYGPVTTTPEQVFSWLHKPLPAFGPDTDMPASLAAVTGGPYLAPKNTLIAVKNTMLANNLATLSPTYNPNWATNPALVNQAAQLNRHVYEALVTLYGMTVVPHSTTGIGVEFRIADGVSWEHWWVEGDGIVVETFPTQMFAMNATGVRQVQRMSQAEQAQYGIVLIPVQSLLPAHSELIGAGLMQYL